MGTVPRVCLGQWRPKSPGPPCPSPTPTRTAASPLTVLNVEFPETATIKIERKSQGSSLASDRLHPCTELHKDARATADQTWKLQPWPLARRNVCDLFQEWLNAAGGSRPLTRPASAIDGSRERWVPAPGLSKSQRRKRGKEE